MKRGIGKAAMAMEKKKKRKVRASDGGSGNYNSSGDGGLFLPPVLPHDLVAAQLLTRLPAKSLMRFKCVSKLWLSTILDPVFCKSHRARSGPRRCTGLLIVSPADKEESQGLGFYLATPSRPIGNIPPLLKPLGPHYRDVFDLLHHQFTLSTNTSPPLDGLVCLYTANRAWLCSVSTGEIMELAPPPPPPPPPLPPSPSEENGAAAIYYKYYLGYDADIQKFKVLRVCSIQDDALFWKSQCEILTLGGETWRRLDGTPPIHIIGWNDDNSVYLSGERHWWHSSGCFLVRFCFTDEEFLLTDLPPRFPELGGSLHEFRGLVALVTGVMDRKLQMWVLRNDHEWSEHTLCIPYAFADRGCCLLGTLGIGLMLMIGPTIEQEDEQQPPPPQLEEEEVKNSKSPLKATPPIYSYDLIFGEFDEFLIGNTFSSMSLVGKDTSKLRIYGYKEDIRPLNHFISYPYD